MKIIEGFEQAKAVLSRQSPTTAYPVSPELGQALGDMFGTNDPEQAVSQIIDEVRERGDKALFDLTFKIDRVKLASLEVGKEHVFSAYPALDEELIAALNLAAEQIRDFHNTQRDNIWREINKTASGQLIRPLQRIGVYVPGGTASYPSTVLMTAIPAKAAGVSEVIMVTPPRADGAIPPATLVAADIAGVDRIFAVGGAQAIAALAYGTESVPVVDKICGPGNIFVVLAKKLVYGTVDIDGLQGPSEVLIIADETANPTYCAADLLAQAEHDSLATAVLVTTSPQFVEKINLELTRQIESLSRRDIAVTSLNRGMIAVVANLDEAVELANLYAPEHLCLMIEQADSYLGKIKNAGCVVSGSKATVVLGDYVAGPSHALPTGGTARFNSPLNVLDFIKLINLVKVNDTILEKLGPAASIIARVEGLDAHARAVEKRLNPD